jgi:hypothetical protein
LNALEIQIAVQRQAHGVKYLIPEAPVRYSRGMSEPWAPGGRSYEMFSDYFADFMMVTDSGYATELEVKVSRSDWKCDLAKPKWLDGKFPPWVTRFIYCVPVELGVPEWVPAAAGVWHLKPWHGGFMVHIARAPKRIGKEKVPQETLDRWMSSMYHRYWNMRHERQRQLQERVRRAVGSSQSTTQNSGVSF